jgi:hypothetical protein
MAFSSSEWVNTQFQCVPGDLWLEGTVPLTILSVYSSSVSASAFVKFIFWIISVGSDTGYCLIQQSLLKFKKTWA